jgi:hypothetical protein
VSATRGGGRKLYDARAWSPGSSTMATAISEGRVTFVGWQAKPGFGRVALPLK